MHALLVDDDRELARLLRDYLASHQVSLEHVDDGDQALERLKTESYDIVLLDVMLPGADGFEICRRIRETHDVPIVMLTARGDDADRVVGLDTGADDYVPKPFNPRELLARLHAVVRRAQPKAPSAPTRLQVGYLCIDLSGHKATLGGRDLPLTSFEFRVLAVLARRAGHTVTREELAAELLPKAEPYDPSVDRSLDVHVSHLRHKLGDAGKEPRLIRTVRGVGYVLLKPSS